MLGAPPDHRAVHAGGASQRQGDAASSQAPSRDSTAHQAGAGQGSDEETFIGGMETHGDIEEMERESTRIFKCIYIVKRTYR